jgi:hypothetical protein
LRLAAPFCLPSLDDARRRTEVAKEIREFLVALVNGSKGQTHDWPIWEGMLKIQKYRGEKDNEGADRSLIMLAFVRCSPVHRLLIVKRPL